MNGVKKKKKEEGKQTLRWLTIKMGKIQLVLSPEQFNHSNATVTLKVDQGHPNTYENVKPKTNDHQVKFETSYIKNSKKEPISKAFAESIKTFISSAGWSHVKHFVTILFVHLIK